jgi:hypothetical protein
LFEDFEANLPGDLRGFVTNLSRGDIPSVDDGVRRLFGGYIDSMLLSRMLFFLKLILVLMVLFLLTLPSVEYSPLYTGLPSACPTQTGEVRTSQKVEREFEFIGFEEFLSSNGGPISVIQT